MDFGDIVVKKLSGSQDELITVTSNGLFVSTGVTVSDITGSVSYNYLEGTGINIVESGNDYNFSVDDYISSTEVENISGSLQSQINTRVILGSSGVLHQIAYFSNNNTIVSSSDYTWNDTSKLLSINGTVSLLDSNNNIFITNNSTPGGIDNVIIGKQAGDGNTGDASTFIGDHSGLNNIAARVIGIGSESANGNEGTECVGVGDDSLKLNTGDRVIGIGGDASREQTGDDVIGLGRSACEQNDGSRVLGWGTNAGFNNSGSDCIFIGAEAGTNNIEDYKLVICAQDSTLSPYILIEGNFDDQEVEINGSVAVQSLSGGNSGNILTWDSNNVLIDSGEAINVVLVENNDVDTGTETLDSITMTTGAVWWDVVMRNGNNIRSGSILANVVNSNVEWSYNGFTADNGNTSNLTYNVIYSGGNLILQAIATSDNWDVRAFRRVITY